MNNTNLGGYLPPNFRYDVEPCIIRHLENNPYIHRLNLKTEYVAPSVKHVESAMHVDEGSDEFLEKADNMSKLVAQAMIDWSSKYFGFMLGSQDALDFLAGNVPADFEMHKILGSIEERVSESLIKELARILSMDTLNCNPEIVAQSLLGGAYAKGLPPETQGNILDRFLKIAKDASNANKE